MSLPKPEPGLVIRYSYLWHAEYLLGHDEGRKDRPCAVLLAIETDDVDRRARVVVLPVTHTPPANPALAIEIPQATKFRLGLDEDRSWIVLSESNEFLWPGPDIRRGKGKGDSSAALGLLPPAFFTETRRRFIALAEASKSVAVKRTE